MLNILIHQEQVNFSRKLSNLTTTRKRVTLIANVAADLSPRKQIIKAQPTFAEHQK